MTTKKPAPLGHEQIRRLALALPEVVEQDHHGRPSFRVAGRIFATLWDAGHMNVMLDGAGIRTAAQSHPDVCTEFWWGRRLGAVQVDLARADEALAGELLADAWEHKAPRRLAQQSPARRGGVSPRALELARRFCLGDDDLRAWGQTGRADEDFDDWLTDRVARRPAGRRARDAYGADDVHDFARRAVLDALAPQLGDRLLEVGCGGGLLLLAVLRECRRVLAPGGRLAVYTTSPRLRGTPAAPEPVASRGHFHESDELVALADRAGFVSVVVCDDDGGQLLTGRA